MFVTLDVLIGIGHHQTMLNPQAGRPGLPPLKCTGHSNKNTAANSGLSTWGLNQIQLFLPRHVTVPVEH